MAVEFTSDQKNAIKAKGTVLVSAAAGSGKTAVLTERVVKKLADEQNGIGADRLLIVTFTNASALEMRVRIAKRLDEMCSENPGNTHLLKQKLLLSSAKICTIDAFCIDLIRSHFALLGINPDFTIAEDSQTSAIKNQCLNDVLSKRYSKKSEAFNNLCLLFGLDRNEKDFYETVYKIHDYCMCMPQPDRWLENAAADYNCNDIKECAYTSVILSYIKDVLTTNAAALTFWLNELRDTELENAFSGGFVNAFEQINYMISLCNNLCWDELYDQLLSFKIEVGRAPKNQNTHLKDLVLAKKNDINKKIVALADKMTGPKTVVLEGLSLAKPIVAELISIVSEFKSAYFDVLNNRNLLTFSHIEQLAFRLLCSEKDGVLVPSKISEEICKDFDEVLVDEYQDNNNLQDALFMALSNRGEHLFMVGDVKQSIYGFRNANPENFLKHKDEFPLFDDVTSPSKVILKENFRSRDGVCDFVNAFCKTVMKTSTCGMEYADEDELKPSAKYCKSDMPDVKILFNDVLSGDKRERIDAEEVAEYIENIVEQPPFLRADKNDATKLRKAEYRDITILLRSPGARAKYYVDALKEKGIPVFYSSGDFFETPEILTAVSILKSINNPTQDISLLGAMMSPVFGFTPDDMALIRTKHRGRTLYSSVCSAAANGDEKCKAFVEILSNLRIKAAMLPVSRLLNEVYNATSFIEIMCVTPESDSAKENLQRLSTLAAKYDSGSSGGISGFVSEFERMSGMNKNAGSNSKTEGNAVRIMSFHGSKGLQFPICIVADCGAPFNKSDVNSQIILNDKLGIGLKYIDDDETAKSTSVAREALSILQRKKLIAEEIRLMYVALTRAEEKLVISLSTKNLYNEILKSVTAIASSEDFSTAPAPVVSSADGYKDWLILTAILQKSGETVCKHVVAETDFSLGTAVFDTKITKRTLVESENAPNAELEKPMAEQSVVDNDLLAEIKNRFDFKYPYEKDSKVPSKMAVTELVHGDSNKFAFTARPEFMSKSGLTPAERGTAAHKFMQFADYSKAEKSVIDEIERLKEWEFISFEEAEALNSDALQKFFQSDVYARIKQASDVKREYKFMVEYPYQEDTTIVQGIADCVFFEDDGVVILDFKTDRVTDASALVELYSGQLQVYKYALEKITGKKVKECVLYSLHLCREVKC